MYPLVFLTLFLTAVFATGDAVFRLDDGREYLTDVRCMQNGATTFVSTEMIAGKALRAMWTKVPERGGIVKLGYGCEDPTAVGPCECRCNYPHYKFVPDCECGPPKYMTLIFEDDEATCTIFVRDIN